LAGEEAVADDATVLAAMTALNVAVQSQTAVAGQACGPEILANKTCHITIDLNTPPIPTDTATVLAAATAIDSTTKLCWLGGTVVANDPGFGTITETFVNFQVYAIPGACTDADRTIGLSWVANQMILASNGTITEATLHWDDDCSAPAPAVAPV
jgi:hypothetical protein